MAEVKWSETELDSILDGIQQKYGVSILGHQDRLRLLASDFATALAHAALAMPASTTATPVGPNAALSGGPA